MVALVNDDIGQHVPLVYRVIGQLNLDLNEQDEAFSQGLVALAEAGISYKPERGPLVNWLARNIRWSLLNWVTAERQRQSRQVPVDPESPLRAQSKPDGFGWTLAQAKALLTEEEATVLEAIALGYSGKEISQRLGKTQTWVSDTKNGAQSKLRKVLG